MNMNQFNDYLAIRETKEQLTEHFSYWEMIRSGAALSSKIPNIPTESEKQNLIKLCEHLEQVRAYLKSPLIVNAGYRSNAINKLVGGSATSSHVYGCAADIKLQAGMYKDILAGIKDKKIDKLDQIIIYQKQQFIHIGIVNPKHKCPRCEVLDGERRYKLICKF